MRYDRPYCLAHPLIKKTVGLLSEVGHELGFHPSYNAQYVEGAFVDELKAVQEHAPTEITGGRQHYLRFNGAKTWQQWENAGLSWDSTVGYADAAGFKCGTARSFPVYDLLERKTLKLEERPLIFMEGALLRNPNLTHDEVFNQVHALGEMVKHYGGNMSMLWHNSKLRTAEEEELFLSLLQDLQ